MNLKKYNLDRIRYENFGGIVSSIDPPFLAWVDRDFMKRIGYEDSPLWKENDKGYLSAPTEVHFSVTNKCSQGCEGCYMSSSSYSKPDLGFNKIKTILTKFREMGVFHVALGGGEAFERKDFSKIVRYCQKIGLVPNLTTNGQKISTREIEICKMMGQVNISLDGIGAKYSINGRKGQFALADKALRELKQNGISTGLNCVVSKKNYPFLHEIVEYAANLGLNEVEFLKYKPSGRGQHDYKEYALSQEMIRNFYPKILKLHNQFPGDLKIDCSFIPALVYHRPPLDDLENFGVQGCDAGNTLLGVKSDGCFSGCSFLENGEEILDLEKKWHLSSHLQALRNWNNKAPEPCASCDYLKICKGGCKAVSLFLEDDMMKPDPECPFVYDHFINNRE